MKTTPIVPAEISFDSGARAEPGQADDPAGTPFNPLYGDFYHSRAGAFDQARHVFLAGNGLPGRWQGRRRFVIFETGFGLGNSFLATWQAWRSDPLRCAQLVYVAIDKHPPRPADLVRVHAHSPAPDLAAALAAQWPPATPDLHTLEFDGGRVRLLLALGDVGTWLPDLVAGVDAFFLDGFAPARNPAMWDPRLFRSCARLATPGASVATWSIARAVRDGLRAAGFEVHRAPGFGSKRDMCQARFPETAASGHRPPVPHGRSASPGARTALVIGAGLAGAAAARALARDGLQVTVLERREAAALETSGNLAGLFHGVVHPNDGAHAQLLRAGALRTAQLLAPLTADGTLPGAVDGLLRGVPPDGDLNAAAARAGLPPAFVQPLSREAASQRADAPLASAQWFFPGGGWVSPPALTRHWLAGDGIRLQTGVAVDHLTHRAENPSGGADDASRWQARDSTGRVLADADVVVLASAFDTPRLLAGWTDAEAWPLERRRGQVTHIARPLAEQAGLPRPALPLASGGYLIALPQALGGGLLCGATAQRDDDDPQLRAEDHAHNLRQVEALTGRPVAIDPVASAGALTGKVGWRLACDDRLPLVGPVPLPAARLAGAARLEQARHVPRVEGLFVLTGLGSRGIAWAPLLGEVLAAWVSGAPVPLAASLLDAIDPARFVSRGVRRGG